MPHTNELEYSVTYTLQDTYTYAYTRVIALNTVTGFSVNDGLYLQSDSDSWNCSIGVNDKMYSNLIAEGDHLSFHFQFPDNLNMFDGGVINGGWKFENSNPGFIALDILATDGTVIEEYIENYAPGADDGVYMTGFSPQGFGYQNIRFQYDYPDCFYFRIRVLNEDGVTFTNYYTEPFRKVSCENTLLMRGYYESGVDNFGFYYGEADSYLGMNDDPHHLQIRVEGELIHDGYNLTHTQVDGETIASQQNEVYRLVLAPVPPYQAKRIANLLSAPYFTIDGIAFTRAKAIQKNNPDGDMWYIDVELERDNTELNFDCN